MSNQSIHPEAFIKLTIVEASWKKDADLLGKQDPFIKWTHNGEEMKTTIKHEAGKHAVFNENFILRNISDTIQADRLFQLESFDDDSVEAKNGTVTKFESIGATKGLSYKEFIKDNSQRTHTLDLFDSKNCICGSITFKTQFLNEDIIVTAAVDQSFIRLTIVEASWKKDADLFGFQDPFIKWTHNGEEMKTTVKDEAGKHAVFNENFILRNISATIQADQLFQLESFDDDSVEAQNGTVTKFESIGATKGLSYKEFTKNKTERTHTLDLFDSKNCKCGSITFKTQYVNPIEIISPATTQQKVKKKDSKQVKPIYNQVKSHTSKEKPTKVDINSKIKGQMNMIDPAVTKSRNIKEIQKNKNINQLKQEKKIKKSQDQQFEQYQESSAQRQPTLQQESTAKPMSHSLHVTPQNQCDPAFRTVNVFFDQPPTKIRAQNLELNSSIESKRSIAKQKKRAKVRKESRELKRDFLNQIRTSQDYRLLESTSPNISSMIKLQYSDEDLDSIKPPEFQKMILEKEAKIRMFVSKNSIQNRTMPIQNSANAFSRATSQANQIPQEELKLNFYQQPAQTSENLDLREQDSPIIYEAQSNDEEFSNDQKEESEELSSQGQLNRGRTSPKAQEYFSLKKRKKVNQQINSHKVQQENAYTSSIIQKSRGRNLQLFSSNAIVNTEQNKTRETILPID